MNHEDSLRDPLTHAVIGAFYDVYNTLAFGLPESLYARALEIELRRRGHEVAREVCFTVRYRGIEIGTLRLDMVVDGCVVVETKSTIELHRGAPRQVLGYLRASGIPVGLVLHFGPEPSVRRITLDGWRARVRDEASTSGDPGAIDEIPGS